MKHRIMHWPAWKPWWCVEDFVTNWSGEVDFSAAADLKRPAHYHHRDPVFDDKHLCMHNVSHIVELVSMSKKQIYSHTQWDEWLRRLGHILQMDDNRLPRQAVHWNFSSTNRKPGRPWKNGIDTIQQDLKGIGMTREVVQQLAVNREGWQPVGRKSEALTITSPCNITSCIQYTMQL